jgi:hypothetical protein
MMRTGRMSLITTLKKAHQSIYLSFIFIFGKGIIKNAHLHCSGIEAEEDRQKKQPACRYSGLVASLVGLYPGILQANGPVEDWGP